MNDAYSFGQDGPCDVCRRVYPPWWADHDWWNEVMGSEAGMLCPTCFLRRADDGKTTVHIARPTPPSAESGDPVTGSWIMEEYERAKKRHDALPDYAKPVITRPIVKPDDQPGPTSASAEPEADR